MIPSEQRTFLIKQLLKAKDDFPLLVQRLDQYEWDFDGTPVLLEKKHLKNILSRYLKEEVSDDFLYEWAEFIELRDDIDYLEEDEETLLEIIHNMASPQTEGNLTHARVKGWVEKLSL